MCVFVKCEQLYADKIYVAAAAAAGDRKEQQEEEPGRAGARLTPRTGYDNGK